MLPSTRPRRPWTPKEIALLLSAIHHFYPTAATAPPSLSPSSPLSSSLSSPLSSPLLQYRHRSACIDWSRIASVVGTRSNMECANKWHRSLNPSIRRGAWSKEEDQLLLFLVHLQRSSRRVDNVSLRDSPISGLNSSTIRNTSLASKSSSVFQSSPLFQSHPWLSSSFECLTDSHDASGITWPLIAKMMNGRTDIQCYNRFHRLVNYFRSSSLTLTNPSSSSSSLPSSVLSISDCHRSPRVKWTPEQSHMLIWHVRIYGNQWTRIVRLMSPTSENSTHQHLDAAQSELSRPVQPLPSQLLQPLEASNHGVLLSSATTDKSHHFDPKETLYPYFICDRSVTQARIHFTHVLMNRIRRSHCTTGDLLRLYNTVLHLNPNYPPISHTLPPCDRQALLRYDSLVNWKSVASSLKTLRYRRPRGQVSSWEDEFRQCLPATDCVGWRDLVDSGVFTDRRSPGPNVLTPDDCLLLWQWVRPISPNR